MAITGWSIARPAITKVALALAALYLKTAKAVGLEIPPTLLAIVDEVIE